MPRCADAAQDLEVALDLVARGAQAPVRRAGQLEAARPAPG